ncbi:MAG: branched-chain amino acid ABC transporter permease [Candidatus Aenigmatarchaeota archaeon]
MQFSKIDYYILIGISILVFTFPLFVSNEYIISVLNFMGINIIIVLGLNLLMGYAGQISLGHAGFFGMGAYVSGILTAKYAFNPWLAFIIAIILTSILAFVIGFPTLKLKGYYLAMATLGFGMIMSIIFVQLDELTGGASGLVGIPSLSINGFSFSTSLRNYFLIWITLFILTILSINLIESKVGRALRAIHTGETASMILGVETHKLKIKVFVLSAIFASIAGSYYAHFVNFISPSSFDFHYSILFITMVILGGMGSIWGSYFGGALLSVLPEFLHSIEDYNIVLYGFLLIIIMFFLPKGVIPTLSEVIRNCLERKESFINRLIKARMDYPRGE